MSQTDKTELEKLKAEILTLLPNQSIVLKDYISKVIIAFNYQDLKLHGHLNELLLTINTDEEPDSENFNDIRKKLTYLIDTIMREY